jgi:EAL domain-containing protein (putative c-di-GMP-specific phosphodiesterase class I)
VKDETHLIRLQALNCTEAQGYYISRPMSELDLRKYLAAETGNKLLRRMK